MGDRPGQRQVDQRSRLRRRLPSYRLPVLRLARLGVDQRAQGLGVGSALLRHVLSLALEQRDALGCIGVVTDAKPEPLEGVRGPAQRIASGRPGEPVAPLKRTGVKTKRNS